MALEATVPPARTSPRQGGGSRRGHSTSADQWVKHRPCLFITTTEELTMKLTEQNGSLRGEGIFSEPWCASMSDGEQEQVIPPPIRVPMFFFSSPLCSVWRLELLEFQVGISKALFSITSVQYHLPEKYQCTASARRVLFVLDDWLWAHRTVGIFNVIVLPQWREIEFLHLCFSKCRPGSDVERPFSLCIMHPCSLQWMWSEQVKSKPRPSLPSLCFRNWKLSTAGHNGYFTPTPEAQIEAIDKIFS